MTSPEIDLAAQFDHAFLLWKKGERSDALDVCAVILDIDPDYADALWLAGTISFEALSFDIAKSCFFQELAINPNSVRPMIALGKLYESTGSRIEAYEMYRQALLVEPGNEIARSGANIMDPLSGHVEDVGGASYPGAGLDEANPCSDLPPPLLVEVEPTNSCNLRCRMCHVALQPREKVRLLDADVFAAATKGLNDCHVIVGSEYEPTIHPQIDRILFIANENFKALDFITNGTRLERPGADWWADVKFSCFHVSVDGITAPTFERIRRGASFDKTIENICRVGEHLHAGGSLLAVNYVVLQSTLAEIQQAVEFWEEKNFDLMRLFPVQLRRTSPELRCESLFPVLSAYKGALDRVATALSGRQYKMGIRASYYGMGEFVVPPRTRVADSVLYSENPSRRVVPTKRQDIQRGQWRDGGFPCKSPFVYARIRWDGAVDLCNKSDFHIGNIHHDSLLDIWHGDRANAIRRYIRRNPQVCESCDYYRLCIAHSVLDINDPASHVAVEIGTTVGKDSLASWLLEEAP